MGAAAPWALCLLLAFKSVASCGSEEDCTLSGECVGGVCVCDKPWTGEQCQTLKLKPAALARPFQPAKPTPDHFTWGAAPFYAPSRGDGAVCMYFTWLTGWADGNHTRPVPAGDKVSGSLGLACADQVTGPYRVMENISFPFRPGQFDDPYIENTVLTRSYEPAGWLMAYTTSPPGVNRSTVNWEGNGETQYMGLAFSTDPLRGPWRRLNRTILQPRADGFEQGIAINPALVAFPNGSLSVTYRGRADGGFGNCRMRSWTEPCVRPPTNLFSDKRWVKAEDPFSYKGPRGYIMLAHTFAHPPYVSQGSGTKAFSRDGFHWTFASYGAYSYTLEFADGAPPETFYRREEPKLLLDAQGLPRALFNVVDSSFLYNDTRIIVQELDYS
eukprot:g3908.t1